MEELTKEQEDLILDDEVRQIANEVEDGRFECFVRDNIDYLREEFIKDYVDQFDDFCREEYKIFNEWGRKMVSKEMKKVIKFDLEALKDSFIFKNKKDFDYHFDLLKGNLEDLGVIEVLKCKI